MHGYGVPVSHTTALQLFQKAAERGNAEAQVGEALVRRRSVPKPSLHPLASSLMHLNGLGTTPSCDVAVSFLKAVAERGPWGTAFTDAFDALSAGKVEKALHLYAALAVGGYEVAQHNVAFLLDEQYLSAPQRSIAGISGVALAERAFAFYRLSAGQGNVAAELRLGDCYYYGQVRPESPISPFFASANDSSIIPCHFLSGRYTHGLGLASDLHLAKRHYDAAIDASADAFLPVQLAMLELRFVQWWQARTGRTDSPTFILRRILAAAAVEIQTALFGSDESTGTSVERLDSLWAEVAPQIENDTILIAILIFALCVVLALRTGLQQDEPAAAIRQHPLR
eukprot:scaffold48096_cov33-Tisochrysis_lutea.AAC.7